MSFNTPGVELTESWVWYSCLGGATRLKIDGAVPGRLYGAVNRNSVYLIPACLMHDSWQ